MMEDLGLGILVSMKDAFSQNAGRVESSMQSLDSTIAASSQRITQNMEMIQHGAAMMGAGLALIAVPSGLVAATIATQSGLAGLRSEGVKDLDAIAASAENFTNQWSGASKAEFIDTCYEVKGALANLSDAAVGEFTAAAALTASATKASVAEMVSAFTTGYGIYKPLAKDMSDMEWAKMFSGGMAQTVAAFKTTGAAMAEAIKNIGAMAASANIPLEEQLAILGQLQTTMPGSEAGTLYKSFIQKVGQGGKELGLTFTDAKGHMLGIVPILQALRQKFPDLASVAAQMQLQKAFGTDEAVKFILQMSAGIETLQGNIEGVKQAMQGGTAVTVQMAQAMTSDIGSGLKLVTQQMKNLAEIAGNTMLPIFTPILQGVQFVVLRMQDWARTHTGLVRGILAASLGLGAFLLVVGSAIALIGSLGLLIPAMQVGLSTIGPMLLNVMGVVSSSFLPAMFIIAGVIAAIWLLRTAWERNFAGIRDVVLNAWTNINAVFMGLSQLISSFNGETGSMSASIAAQLEKSGLLNFVVTVFQVYTRVRSFLIGLWQGFNSFFGNIRAAIEPSISTLVNAFVGLFSALVRVFGIVQSVKVEVAGTTGSWRTFGRVVGEVLGFIGQTVATVFSGVIWVITGIVQVIRGVVSAFGWLREGMTVVSNLFVNHWGTISSVTKWAAIVLGTVFGPALIQTGIQATIAGARIISNFVMGLQLAGSISLARTINQIQTIVSTSWSNLINGINGTWQALRTAAITTLQYAAAGWRAVAALSAQGVQWVVLQARAVASNAALLIQRGIMLAGAAATWIATAATTAFGIAMTIATGPIGLICLAIAALIGIGILVWKNWDNIKTFLLGCWNGLKQAAIAAFNGITSFLITWGPTILAVIAGPIGLLALVIYKNWDKIKSSLEAIWGSIKNSASTIWDGLKNATSGAIQYIMSGFTNLIPNALDAGKKLMTALGDGIKSAVSAPFEALKAGLGKLGKLLPHSDAELGPLSTLTQSGFSVLDTMSRGIARASHLPVQAMEQAFTFGNNLPAIMPPALAPATAGTPAVQPFVPVPVRQNQSPVNHGQQNEPVRDLLALIASKLDAINGNTHGDTVVTLDGREIARAVYRDMRERRVRGYENF